MMRIPLNACRATALLALSACADTIYLPPTAPQPEAASGTARALSGDTPGVTIRANAASPGARIRIDGNWGPNGPSPLYVIDGVAVDSAGLARVNPLEILDVSVVKGPAAVARYGQRAADGAVLVRTKSGTPH